MINRRSNFPALLALVLATSFADVSEAAVIRFRPRVEATSTLVTLGDVAEILAPPDEAAALRAISLAPAPAPGGTSRLEFDAIRARLVAQGVNVAAIDFAGSSAVLVSVPAPVAEKQAPDIEQVSFRAPPPLTPAQRQRAESLVSDAVRQHLRRTAPHIGRVQVALQLDDDQVAAALAGSANGFDVQGGTEPWDAPQQFVIRTLDRRNEVREFAVAGRLTPFPFALAAKHSLPRGHVIGPGDLAWKQTDEAENILVQPELIVGQEVQTPLKADELLRPGSVRPIALVRSNDIVTVYARRGGITVKRQLKSRSSGALGETVNLVTLDGRQTIVARVIGFHEAELPGAANEPAATEVTDPSGRIRFERPAR